MKLIIDIPDKDYEKLKDGHIPFSILDVIQNGTPIPDNATVCDIEQIMQEIEDLIVNTFDDGFYIKTAYYVKINSFTSGLKTALQIIDKYKAESDDKKESEFRRQMRLSRGASCYLDQGITQC